MADEIDYQLAIYYLPKPQGDPLAKLTELLKSSPVPFEQVESITGKVTTPHISAFLKTNLGNYAPADLDSLRYFGRGLAREQAEALQQSAAVLLVDFSYPREFVWTGLRASTNLMHELAIETGGLLWDEATRETFTPAAWQERRLDDWTDQIPVIANHTTIHAYQKDEYVRAITLGMEKFGLPEVVVDNFPWSLQRNMGHVINLFSQAIAEGAEVPRPGEFDLDLRSIQNATVREPQVASLKDNATGLALLSLRKGTWEEGDPVNLLIEITFDRGQGPDAFARQEQVLTAAFGSEDSVTRIRHDKALKAASKKAREQLPKLRAEFNQGLAPGEFIQLKAPFATPDGGQEWMWVEVASWKGDNISGLLKNEPFNNPTLHAGQQVQVSESKIFDYMRKHADGTSTGNETAKLSEAQGK